MRILSAEDLNFENDLAHFGVLGMKWGRRKAKSSSGGSKKKIAKKPISQEEQKKRLKTVAKAAGIVALAGVGVAAGYGLGSVSSKKQIKSLESDIRVNREDWLYKVDAYNDLMDRYMLARSARKRNGQNADLIDDRAYALRL